MQDGTVKVDGGFPDYPVGNAYYKILEKVIAQHGDRILKYSNKYGFPPAWTAAIMCIESGGNDKACSPCSACPSIPNCGPCCAYGLMQFIDSTARSYGVPGGGPGLMGQPDIALDAAVRFLMDQSKRYGMDIVKLSGAYNAGSWKCRSVPTNWFGNVEDNNSAYAEKGVRWANTAIRTMKFGTGGVVPGGASTGISTASLAGIGLLAVGGYLLWQHFRR